MKACPAIFGRIDMKLSLHEKILGVLAALFVTVLLVSSFLPLFGRMTVGRVGGHVEAVVAE